MSTYAITFTVTGGGEFPMDMLRYDHVAPYDSADATAIYNSFYAHRDGFHAMLELPQLQSMTLSYAMEEIAKMLQEHYVRPVIKLTRYSERRLWVPTTMRWASFGWTVDLQSIESLKVPA